MNFFNKIANIFDIFVEVLNNIIWVFWSSKLGIEDEFIFVFFGLFRGLIGVRRAFTSIIVKIMALELINATNVRAGFIDYNFRRYRK
jgi:hypothetical protein